MTSGSDNIFTYLSGEPPDHSDHYEYAADYRKNI